MHVEACLYVVIWFYIWYYQYCRFCICNICCRWQGSSCLSANWIRVKLWSSKHENNLGVITMVILVIIACVRVCVPAVMWTTAGGWKTCSLIYSEAVNFFPPRERDKHNKTPPTQSHEPLLWFREWVPVGCLISLLCFAVCPPCLHHLSLRGSFWWRMARKPTGSKQSTHHQTMILASMSQLSDRQHIHTLTPRSSLRLTVVLQQKPVPLH